VWRTRLVTQPFESLMKKTLKWTGIIVVVLLVVIQAIRPARTNPEVDESKTISAAATVTSDVSAILQRACDDCHSNKTTWPWYSEIAPVSWLLVDDVNDGRKDLSLSEWGTYDTQKKARKLKKICEEVESGGMPLKSYLLLHPAARLSDSDKQILCEWTRQETERLAASQISIPPKAAY
jgi:Haem-binding domain